MKNKKLIVRIFRVSDSDNKIIKRNSKKHDSESAYIRHLIRKEQEAGEAASDFERGN